jgi:hypothetical protein
LTTHPSAKHFVLRIWLEPRSGDAPVWRASLTHTETRETRYFASLEALARHLHDLADPALGTGQPSPEPT